LDPPPERDRHGQLTIDAGKQFSAGARPTSSLHRSFSPRDFLNVVFTDFLPVTSMRADIWLEPRRSKRSGSRSSPSRAPLIDQR
jgi:hypothetical protein